jgi:UDP-GlcNAc:undecaprenyl-phosphate GlcNAc-1-phosphate transferase
MNTYFAIFLIATFSSLIITPLVRRLCERFHLLDIPVDGRKVHIKAVPRLGGVAIYAACVIALSTLPFVDNLLTQSLHHHTSEIFTALIPATLVLLLGIYDDLRGTNASVKFAALGLIATLFYVMGGRIEILSIPFVGPVHLPSTLSFMLTILWLVGIANAFNLIDGLDGLASGAALFSTLVILVVSFSQSAPVMIVVALVLCGALAGFLRYNFNPASIFLGDSGALFVGFTLAALSVLGSQKATTAVAVVIPVLAFGLPVIDTGVTMARRLISRKPLFQGDNEHIHHMLLARGWSQRQVALILYGVSAIFGLVAMLFVNTGSRSTAFVLFVVAVVVIIAMGHLRYHEMDELKAGMKRTVADRRIRVANNIRVRRAIRALGKARTMLELFEAVTQMLDCGEFVYANAQIGRPVGGESAEHALGMSELRGPQRCLELRNGRILWSWERGDVAAEDVIGTDSFWCLRLPLATAKAEWGWINLYRTFDSTPLLVDMNYLSNLFRRALSEAAERIVETSSREAASAA